MAPYRIRPMRLDIAIANAVAEYTSPRTEQVAGLLTWGADEHVLLAIAAGWWLYCRGRQRENSDHILLTTFAVIVAPHLLKSIFNQRRPDRLTVRGHLHGVPVSGKPLDAFPSGHAMHVGALASAATVLPPTKRNLVWALGAGRVEPGRAARTLGKRRRRRPRARRAGGAAAASAHRLWRIEPEHGKSPRPVKAEGGHRGVHVNGDTMLWARLARVC
jgi:hypothetical protein